MCHVDARGRKKPCNVSQADTSGNHVCRSSLNPPARARPWTSDAARDQRQKGEHATLEIGGKSYFSTNTGHLIVT